MSDHARYGFFRYIMANDCVAYRICLPGQKDPITGTEPCFHRAPSIIRDRLRELYTLDASDSRDFPREGDNR